MFYIYKEALNQNLGVEDLEHGIFQFSFKRAATTCKLGGSVGPSLGWGNLDVTVRATVLNLTPEMTLLAKNLPTLWGVVKAKKLSRILGCKCQAPENTEESD